MEDQDPQHHEHHDGAHIQGHQSNTSSPLPPPPSQTITVNTLGSGTPRASSFVFRPFSSRPKPQIVPSIMAGRSHPFTSSLRGPVHPSLSPFTPVSTSLTSPTPTTPTAPITTITPTSRAISGSASDNNRNDERSVKTLASKAISFLGPKCASKNNDQASCSSTAHVQQKPHPHMGLHEHDTNSVEQLNLLIEDNSAGDTSNVTDHHHDVISTSSEANEPNVTTFLVRPKQDSHESGSSSAIPQSNMDTEQEPSAYYADLMQCIDRVTKSYRDTISRQNQRLSEVETSLSQEKGRLRVVEDVGLALKDQNQTILGKNVQLEREVAQLQMHETFMESQHSKEITRQQDLSIRLKDSMMAKVGSLDASCLGANGDLDKLREHLMQYGNKVRDFQMSLERWHSERDILQKSLEQAIENTYAFKEKKVHVMTELQQKYENAISDLGVFRQRSESHASINENLQQRMQQLASDHQRQLYEMAKNTESLENEVKLLTMAKDYQHDEFKAQVASLERLLHDSRSNLDRTKMDLGRIKLDFSNVEATVRTREERIESLEEQLKKPETRTAGASTGDDASFDLCVSYNALQGQNLQQKDQIDALQGQNRALQEQSEALQGGNRALHGQIHELMSQIADLRTKISDIKEEKQMLVDERDRQDGKIEALEQSKLTLELTSSLAEKLQSEVRALKNKLEASVAELSKQKDKTKQLATQLTENEREKSDLKAQLIFYQSKVQGFQAQFEDYHKLHEVESQNKVKLLQNTIQSQQEQLEAWAKEIELLRQSIRDIDKVKADLEAWKRDHIARNQGNQAEIEQLKTALEDAQNRDKQAATSTGAPSPMPLMDIARVQSCASSWTDFLKWPTDTESPLVSSDTALLQTSSIVDRQDTELAPSLEHHGQEKTSSAKIKRTSNTTVKEAPEKENAPQVEATTVTKGKKGKGKGKAVTANTTSTTNKDDDDDFVEPPSTLVEPPSKCAKRQYGNSTARRVLITASETVEPNSDNTLPSTDTSMSSPEVGNARKRPLRRANK
ncbi:hypothetical protein MVEG_03238 [Podila verticillata NRRL 6337]|nr:hypothetical protein MVEG_03238 [Podila verticillata NRRL 6337]